LSIISDAFQHDSKQLHLDVLTLGHMMLQKKKKKEKNKGNKKKRKT